MDQTIDLPAEKTGTKQEKTKSLTSHTAKKANKPKHNKQTNKQTNSSWADAAVNVSYGITDSSEPKN